MEGCIKMDNNCKNESNRVRLQALIELFDLNITEIAKIAGVSRPQVSRVLHVDMAGDRLWSKLERKLPELIAKRRQPFFQLEAVGIEKVIEIIEQLKQVA